MSKINGRSKNKGQIVHAHSKITKKRIIVCGVVELRLIRTTNSDMNAETEKSNTSEEMKESSKMFNLKLLYTVIYTIINDFYKWLSIPKKPESTTATTTTIQRYLRTLPQH